ncbi:FAD:protein FMN transferase [Ruegeria sp. EL01]|jgi:thiamine biosynthesis lipoprotein|uniref:FAD:protein FMN transferase n=1 Tax=Ruegeria sp. EL01 TaxID=2107578 RepID=UPI000EA83734|nr:FAD:protein FMN transferase [Ruegeria sp. EL01]
MIHLSRRRFLFMSAACVAFPAGATPAPTARWRGTALGASASLRLDGLTETQAAPIFAAVEAEVTRLENIFSLYRPDSELCRLNRDGHLLAPAPELLDVFGLCTALFEATDGVFDPTIQPLWAALATGAHPDRVTAARDTVGWNRMSVQTDQIRLPQPGQSALTLNGIAQGAITDRIGALLSSYGLRDVLVNMGEIAAHGQRADGQDWRVGLAGPEGKVQKTISLRDRAVATSDPSSMMLADHQGHILNPNGNEGSRHVVSVSAPNAALADGLSTALCQLRKHRMKAVIAAFSGTTLEMVV